MSNKLFRRYVRELISGNGRERGQRREECKRQTIRRHMERDKTRVSNHFGTLNVRYILILEMFLELPKNVKNINLCINFSKNKIYNCSSANYLI